MGLIPTNRTEAVIFWSNHIQLFHPDDDPAEYINKTTGEFDLKHLRPAWVAAWQHCDPWSLEWSDDFKIIPHDSRAFGPVFCAVCGDVEIDDALVPLGVRTCHDCEVLRPAECAEVNA